MTNQLLRGLAPTHPGEILREDVLPALGKPKTEIARALHVSRQQLYDILNEEKPITSQMALRIGKLTGSSPEMWLRMQCAYDLATLEPRMADELAQIPVLEAA
ncbi:MAG TPA: HigA family addiction module antitoxin [Allosphingosinicella sp.]|nr:HigA family addiction module antitoxin [Allosphingosinicella sp.]